MYGKFVAFETNIHIRTYERDSDRQRLREDVLLRFRALKCCGFL